jgi:hypothetical protein
MEFTQHHIHEFLGNFLPEGGQGENLPFSFNIMLKTPELYLNSSEFLHNILLIKPRKSFILAFSVLI